MVNYDVNIIFFFIIYRVIVVDHWCVRVYTIIHNRSGSCLVSSTGLQEAVQKDFQMGLQEFRTSVSGYPIPSTTMVVQITDLNTWIAGSHGFAYSSMRATGNPSAAILLQSKHWIDTLTYAHVSAWNATGDRFLVSNFMKILKKKNGKVPQIFKTLKYLLKIAKNLLMLINLNFVQY